MRDEKLIIFDMNGVVTDGCAPISNAMRNTIADINKPIAIISGASLFEMHKALRTLINDRVIYLLPEYGSSCFHSGGIMIYEKSKPFDEKLFSRLSLFADMALDLVGIDYADSQVIKWHSQATISITRKDSPLGLKRNLDKTGVIRRKIIHTIFDMFNLTGEESELTYTLAGHSSIDIREDGWDKREGIETFLEWMCVHPSDAAFYGDRILPGYANWPTTYSGVNVIEARNMNHALRMARRVKRRS